MQFSHSPAIWTAFPSLVAGLLLVENVNSHVQVQAQLAPFYERARRRLAGRSESDLAEIQAWRRAFSQMGMKPTQYRSAAEALLRRFRKEDTLPSLHPLVDLCNAVSLAYALPIAVIDLDQVKDCIHVRHAEGDEIYQAFSGETEHPDVDEVIFADAARQVHARRWTFRQGRRSTVSTATRRALVVNEALHASAAADIPVLLETLEHELRVIGFTPSRQAVLSADKPLWTDKDEP